VAAVAPTPLRVLLIEDSEDDALQELRLLERGGLAVVHQRVESLAGVREALAGPAWDLVICDFTMPGFDGTAALTLVRAHDPDVPFIVVSGTIGEEVAVAMMKSGASDYVMKKSLERLVPAVRRELREAQGRHARRLAETALHESDQRFRQLAEAIRDVFFLIDPVTSKILYLSPAYERFFGRPSESAYAEPGVCISACHPEDREHALATVVSGNLTGFDYECRIYRPDGQMRYIQVRGFPVMDDTGKPYRTGGIITDITERKRAEQAVVDSEIRLQALFEHSAEVTAISGTDGRIMYLSPSIKRITGYEPAMLVGRNLLELVHPDDRATVVTELADLALHPGAVQRVERRYRVKDGTWRVSENVAVNLTHIAAIGGIVTTMRDITERRQAADALRASEQEFRTLAESMPQIVWVTRADGWNIYFNQQWMDYTGLTLDQSLGEGWNKPFHPDDQQRAWDAWQFATATKGIYSIESRLRRADGVYRWWLVRGVPLTDVNGAVLKWFGTCTDIHDLKMAEHEISRANGALRESERRFHDMLDNVALVSMMLDRQARITYCNDFLLQLTGWQREEIIGRDWFELFLPPPHEKMRELHRMLFAEEASARSQENDIVTRTGARRLIRWNNSLLRSPAGDIVGIASIGEDITDRRAAELRIAYLSRVFATLSGINTLIVRATTTEQLYREACRVAVDIGGFRMALICMAAPGALALVPVASAGKSDALMADVAQVLASSDSATKTMLNRAFREKRAVVANDSLHDDQVLLGGKYAESGVCSMAVLPLLSDGEPVGVLALYAGEIAFFHGEELKLLTELAADIGFAIDHISKRERLDYLAYYDVLTGLANRTLFLQRLDQTLEHF
jgi:PAS domain S-box-containing protein